MGDVSCNVDGRLRRIDRAHDIGVGCGVQTEGPGDAGHLSRGEHQPQAQQGVVLEDHEPRHEDGGLQKGRQTQANYLLDPLDEAVDVASGNAEHIETPHGDLYEQDTAPFQVAEKHLNHGVGHEDDTEQQHERAGEHAQAEMQGLVGHIHKTVHALEVVDNRLSHGADVVAIPGESRGEGPLQGDRQGVEPHRHGREQADGHEALEGVDGGLLKVPPAGGVFDAELEGRDHQADGEQGPGQLGEKQDDGLDPFQVKEFHAHVSHLGEEVAEEAHHLAVEPVDEVVHNCGRYKVPNKNDVHLSSVFGKNKQGYRYTATRLLI